jgi:hypothetical protein
MLDPLTARSKSCPSHLLNHVFIIIVPSRTAIRCCSLPRGIRCASSIPIVVHLSVQLLLRLPRASLDHDVALFIRPGGPLALATLTRPQTTASAPRTTTTRRAAAAALALTWDVTVDAFGIGKAPAATIPGATGRVVTCRARTSCALDTVKQAPPGTLDKVKRIAWRLGARQEAEFDWLAARVGSVELCDGFSGVLYVVVGDKGDATAAVLAVIENLDAGDWSDALE